MYPLNQLLPLSCFKVITVADWSTQMMKSGKEWKQLIHTVIRITVYGLTDFIHARQRNDAGGCFPCLNFCFEPCWTLSVQVE